jgi:hypothetical protein
MSHLKEILIKNIKVVVVLIQEWFFGYLDGSKETHS